MESPQQHIPAFEFEGLNFKKLHLILRANLLLFIVIFFIINLGTFLFIRYTKDQFESSSEIKLDFKNNATGLGIGNLVEGQDISNMSGEIELLQSRLFLGRVLDSLNLSVAYFSRGEFLDYEIFGNYPFHIQSNVTDPTLYNVPLLFQDSPNGFILQLEGSDVEWRGKYGVKNQFNGLEITIDKTLSFEDHVSYYFILNSRDALLNYLSSNLTVAPLNFEANTLLVSFKDYSPLKAQTIVNFIDSLFMEYSYEQKNLANKQKIEWVTNELSQIESQMGDFEQYFENFTLVNKSKDLDADLKITVERIARIDSQRYNHTNILNGINSLYDQVQGGVYMVTSSQRNFLPPFIHQQLDDLHKLSLAMGKLKLSYHESTFAYREKEKGLANAKNEMLSQLTDLKNDALKKLQELNRQKVKLENTFINLPDKSTQFNKKQRFYKLYEELYLTLMQSKSQFEINQAGSTPDYKILSPASIPSAPVSPKKFLLYGIGLVASIFVNIFLIGILYIANNKIVSVRELEGALQLPVIGMVPALLNTIRENPFYIVDHPRSLISEAIRTIRTNLTFFDVSAPIKVIAISSTISGEGKSFVAKNFGATLSLSKKKTILLDLDMRKISKSPKDSIAQKGISTILTKQHSWKDCMEKTCLDHLDTIPSGPHPPNPAELLINGEFDSLLTDLKKEYDYIILDTPPAGLVTDGVIAMKKADLSIYVFRANYSKRDYMTTLQRLISLNNFPSLTVLLNALPRFENKTYGYYELEEKKPWWKSLFWKS